MTSPWPLQSECDAFYGNPRGRNGNVNPAWESENLFLVACPWRLFFEGAPLKGIRIHRKCAASLTRALTATWKAIGQDQNIARNLKYDLYSGSFNFRPMRGGAALSMHAYGCAIDWDAEDNPQHSQKHVFTADSPLIKAFKDEGWAWGGDWAGNSIDAQHLQAARVR